LVIESTACAIGRGRKEDIAVACLYWNFVTQQEQTIANMMGAVLKELVGWGISRLTYEKRFGKGKM